MEYSLSHFLRHFPWRHYLTGGLFCSGGPTVAVLTTSRASPALIMRGSQALWFEDDAAVLPDAPPAPAVDGEPAFGNGRSFTAKLLARGRAKGSARYLFLPELTANDFYCNVHGVANLPELSVEALLESLREDPRQVFGAWDETREFRWAIVSSELQPLRTGTLDRRHAEVVVLGLPEAYCERVDAWVERQGATLAAIVPPALACLKWFLEAMAPRGEACALLLELHAGAVLAVFGDDRLVLLRQLPADAEDVFGELADRAREFRLAADRVFFWNLGSGRLQPPRGLAVVPVTAGVLREVAGGPLVYRGTNGARLETQHPAAHLLRWIAGQMV